MKKPFNLLIILFLYLVTVPTNVISLGAFTEPLLKDFQISRQTLSLLYLSSTLIVFLLLFLIKTRCSLKKILITIGIFYQLPVFIPSSTTLIFSIIVLQWLGQGWLVELCRILLLHPSIKIPYGTAVGLLEATGTIAIFLCPFFFLFLLKTFTWKTIFIFLGILYIGLASLIPSYTYTTEHLPILNIFDWKFLISNLLIYTPVILASGFFFHLEACCRVFHLSIDILNNCAWQQGIGIVIFQILFGRLWKCNGLTAYIFLALLLTSQIFWFFNLFTFSPTTYLITTILGWSFFGILINAFWQFLYPKNPEQKLQASVGLGFLANAIGPLLFYLFLKPYLLD